MRAKSFGLICVQTAQFSMFYRVSTSVIIKARGASFKKYFFLCEINKYEASTWKLAAKKIKALIQNIIPTSNVVGNRMQIAVSNDECDGLIVMQRQPVVRRTNNWPPSYPINLSFSSLIGNSIFSNRDQNIWNNLNIFADHGALRACRSTYT